MTEDEAFIRAVVESPGDDTPRLVYADWLDDRSDPRGPYLRAELDWAKPWQSGRRPRSNAAIRKLAARLDPVWVARVSRPPVGVCSDHVRFVECGPRLTPGKVAAAEKAIGCTFPPAYRAFLLDYNAGRVEPRNPPPSEGAVAVCEQGETFYNLGRKPRRVEEGDPDLVRGAAWMRELAAEDPLGEDFPIDRLLPLGAPHWDYDALFLGIGPKEFGKVFLLDNLQDHGFDRDNLSEIAASLPEFLATLKPKWVE